MITTKIKTIEVEVTDKLFCDNCKQEIPLMFPDPSEKTMQGQDALHIHLSGGFGMFIDNLGYEDPDFLFCKSCAEKLLKVFACFKWERDPDASS